MKKMQVIAVSGSVGSGKTTVAKRLAKQKGYRYINAKQIIEKNKLKEKYDRKRQTYDVDVKRLNRVLIKLIESSKKDKKIKGLVIDSHLSHYLPGKYIDLCIITACSNLKELEKRLKKRGYSKAKIDENIECEIMKVCLMEAKEAGHKIKVVETRKKR